MPTSCAFLVARWGEPSHRFLLFFCSSRSSARPYGVALTYHLGEVVPRLLWPLRMSSTAIPLLIRCPIQQACSSLSLENWRLHVTQWERCNEIYMCDRPYNIFH